MLCSRVPSCGGGAALKCSAHAVSFRAGTWNTQRSKCSRSHSTTTKTRCEGYGSGGKAQGQHVLRSPSLAAMSCRLQRVAQVPPSYHACPSYSDWLLCSDRPACETVKGRGKKSDQRLAASGRLSNCNVRLQAASIRRLVDHVDAALLRWAEDTGRRDALEPLLGPLAGSASSSKQQAAVATE